MDLTTPPARQALQPAGAGDGGPALAGLGPCLDLDGIVVVQVEGDIDLYSGPQLRQTLKDLLPLGRPLRSPDGEGDVEPLDRLPVHAVVVDFTGVDFMDSFAVGVLVHGYHLARAGGRAYALVATNQLIYTLFDITGLSKVLPLHPDLPTALQWLHPADRDTEPARCNPAGGTAVTGSRHTPVAAPGAGGLEEL